MDAQGGIGYSKLLLMQRSNEMKHGAKEAHPTYMFGQVLFVTASILLASIPINLIDTQWIRTVLLGAAYGLAVYLRQGVERWWFLERNCAR